MWQVWHRGQCLRTCAERADAERYARNLNTSGIVEVRNHLGSVYAIYC